MIYKALKQKQRDRQPLLPSEREHIARVEAIVGYEIALHLPLGSKFILGADDAERILERVASAA